MAGFVTDNAFEIELNKMLTAIEELKKEQTAFMSTHHVLPVKEKVLKIQKIQADQKRIHSFIEKSKQEENFNSGIKFKYENLKAKFSSLMVLWRKIEASTEK